MAQLPSQELLDRLAALRLADRDAVAAVAPRVRRLAGDLASFDLAWIDALKQASIVTPWQAERLQRGDYTRLAVGEYILYAPKYSLGWANVFRARHRDSGAWRQLYLAPFDPSQHADVELQLKWLVEKFPLLDAPCCLPVIDAGPTEDQSTGQFLAWAVTNDAPRTRRVVEWTTTHGRMPTHLVTEIARQSLQALAHLQAAEQLHGDLSVASLLVDATGQVQLAAPGLRGIVRPQEGFAHADLPTESYDTLAPERIEPPAPPTRASEAYSLAAAWWQLLSARPPFPGGDALTKLRNLHRGRWPDIAVYAPNTTPALQSLIKQMTDLDPASRPTEFEQLATALEESTASDRQSLGRAMQPPPTPLRWERPRLTRAVAPHETFPWSMALVVLAAFTIGVAWPLWGRYLTQRDQPFAAAETEFRDVALTDSGQQPRRLIGQGDASPAVDEVSFNKQQADVAAVSYEETAPFELLLESGTVSAWPASELADGTLVRPRGGGRATVEVPAGGIAVEASDVTFQDTDFVPTKGDPLIKISGGNVQFERCTFRAASRDLTSVDSVAIQIASRRGTRLTSQRVRFADCHFNGWQTAISQQATDNTELVLNNSLVTSCATAIAWVQPPLEAECRLELDQATIRDVGHFLVITKPASDSEDDSARIEVVAHNAVFQTGESDALIEVQAANAPLSVLQLFGWSGEGSMLDGQSPLFIWSDGMRTHSVEESQLAIEGLARTDIEFAGDNLADAADSVAIDWFAPRIAAAPPGIDATRIPAAKPSLNARDAAGSRSQP